jgi:hypothetical protein
MWSISGCEIPGILQIKGISVPIHLISWKEHAWSTFDAVGKILLHWVLSRVWIARNAKRAVNFWWHEIQYYLLHQWDEDLYLLILMPWVPQLRLMCIQLLFWIILDGLIVSLEWRGSACELFIVTNVRRSIVSSSQWIPFGFNYTSYSFMDLPFCKMHAVTIFSDKHALFGLSKKNDYLESGCFNAILFKFSHARSAYFCKKLHNLFI